jgi:hypothetical protein
MPFITGFHFTAKWKNKFHCIKPEESSAAQVSKKSSRSDFSKLLKLIFICESSLNTLFEIVSHYADKVQLLALNLGIGI